LAPEPFKRYAIAVKPVVVGEPTMFTAYALSASVVWIVAVTFGAVVNAVGKDTETL
jgi:hypothetical protein